MQRLPKCLHRPDFTRAKNGVKEHKRHSKARHKLAQHRMLHRNKIDLEEVEIIDGSTTWKQRLIVEAWHSVREVSFIYEHIAFPDLYKNLTNF